MANDTVRPYMDKTAFEELTKIYPIKEDGLNRCVNAFLSLRKTSLRELKGIFNRNELTGIVAAFNGTGINFSISISPLEMLRVEMEDSIELEYNDTQFQYDATQLFAKILRLDNLKAMFLLEEIHRFWKNNSSEENSLDTFLDTFEARRNPFNEEIPEKEVWKSLLEKAFPIEKVEYFTMDSIQIKNPLHTEPKPKNGLEFIERLKQFTKEAKEEQAKNNNLTTNE